MGADGVEPSILDSKLVCIVVCLGYPCAFAYISAVCVCVSMCVLVCGASAAAASPDSPLCPISRSPLPSLLPGLVAVAAVAYSSSPLLGTVPIPIQLRSSNLRIRRIGLKSTARPFAAELGSPPAAWPRAPSIQRKSAAEVDKWRSGSVLLFRCRCCPRLRVRVRVKVKVRVEDREGVTDAEGLAVDSALVAAVAR